MQAQSSERVQLQTKGTFMVTHPYLFKITPKSARKEKGNKQNNPAVELKKEFKWVLLNAVVDLLDNSGPQSEGGPPNKL